MSLMHLGIPAAHLGSDTSMATTNQTYTGVNDELGFSFILAILISNC